MAKQPRKESKPRKYVVRVPVTVTVCCEVIATSPEDAIKEANAKLNELTPLYPGYGVEIEKPNMLEADEGWFEDFDACEIFIAANAKATRK